MREILEYIELYPGTDDGDNSLWVRIKGHDNMGDTVVGFHSSPPDQDEEINGTFCGQLEIALCSWALVLWETSTTLMFVRGATRLDTQEVTADD